MGRQTLNIFHDNLIVNTSGINSPAAQVAYPIGNLIQRTPSIVTRLTGNGSPASPNYIIADLLSQPTALWYNRIEAVAVVGTNVKRSGSVIFRATNYPNPGPPVGSPGNWEIEKSLHTSLNWLINGGAERGDDIYVNNVPPANGSNEIGYGWALWDATGLYATPTAGYVLRYPYGYPFEYAPFLGEVITQPISEFEYTNRYFIRVARTLGALGEFRALAFSPYVRVLENEKYVGRLRYRLPQISGGTPPEIMIAALDINKAVVQETRLPITTPTAQWLDAEVELTIGGDYADVAYLVLGVSFPDDGLEGDWFDLDDMLIFEFQDDDSQGEYYTEYPETGIYLLTIPEKFRHLRWIQFDFINDNPSDAVGYIDVGKLLVGKLFEVSAGSPLNYDGDFRQDPAWTGAGIFYLQSGGVVRPQLQFPIPLDRRGPFEELRQLAENNRGDMPLLFSLYEETIPTRCAYGTFINAVRLRETGIPYLGSVEFTLAEEK